MDWLADEFKEKRRPQRSMSWQRLKLQKKAKVEDAKVLQAKLINLPYITAVDGVPKALLLRN